MSGGGWCDDEGQMVVEMAVIAPVMIAVSLVVLNLMWFLEAASRFDRAAPDAVVANAVSPAGGTGGAHEHEVASSLQDAMEGLRGVTVSARAETLWDDLSSGAGFTMAPHLTRYVCTMEYAPWPTGFSIAGIDIGAPMVLRHECSFVVDCYRSGVVF